MEGLEPCQRKKLNNKNRVIRWMPGVRQPSRWRCTYFGRYRRVILALIKVSATTPMNDA